MKLLRVVAVCGALIAVTQGAVLAQKGRGHRGGFGRAGLVLMPEVQRDLRLESEQLDRLQVVHQEMGARSRAVFAGLQNLSREEREQRFTTFNGDYNRRIDAILDDRQEERLKQLDLQRGGIRALTRAEVASELRLSADQRQRIESAFEGEHEAMRAAVGSIQSGTTMTKPQREEFGRKFREVRAQTEGRVLGILTDGQRRSWQAMQGPPFKFPEFRPRRPE